MKEHKELLQKWLKVLLYAQIVSMAVTVINAVTHLDNITAWILKAIKLVALWSLFHMKDVNPRYRTSAITKLGALICGLLTTPVNTRLGLSSLLMLVGSGCSWVTTYQEYHAHGELVAETDRKLAKKWKDLFVWEIVIGLGISFISVGATTVLVAAGAASSSITTVIIILTTLVSLALEALYLLYMKRTLELLEN